MISAPRAPRAIIVDNDVAHQLRLRSMRGLASLDPVCVRWGVQVAPLVTLLEPLVVVACHPPDDVNVARLIGSASGDRSPAVFIIRNVADVDALEIALAASGRGDQPATPATVLQLGHVAIDLDRGEVIRGSERTLLAPRERALLMSLLRASGDIVTREEIIRDVWAGRAIASRVVDRQVVALRRRIERDPRRPRHLVTVFARGYRFVV